MIPARQIRLRHVPAELYPVQHAAVHQDLANPGALRASSQQDEINAWILRGNPDKRLCQDVYTVDRLPGAVAEEGKGSQVRTLRRVQGSGFRGSGGEMVDIGSPGENDRFL